MKPILTLIDIHPTEDKAISSLLEIDLKDQQEQPSWTDQKKFAQLGHKHRFAHNNKMHPVKHQTPLKYSPKKQDESPSLRLSYNPEMLQPNSTQENDLAQAEHEQGLSKSRESKQKKFNEGEYWSSKVNWMSNSVRQQVRSQPKLSKKFSFGYQINLRQTWKGTNSRYEPDQKSRHQEYKTNLIYSILSGEAEALRFRHLQEKSKMISNRSYESTPRQGIMIRQAFKYDFKTKRQSQNGIMSKNLQDTMRKTLKKISAKNYQDGPIFNQNPNNKPSEVQRAALVRQMLQNIESAKDKVPVVEPKQDKKELKVELRHQQIVDDIMQPFVSQKKEIKPKSNVLNLNLQAEKIYKGKTVSRWNGRRIIQSLKLH